MPSENDDDPLSALKRGDLNVHSARMELVQNTSNQPGRYIGNGYIKQKEDGIIEFTLDAARGRQRSSIFRFIVVPNDRSIWDSYSSRPVLYTYSY